MIEAATINTVMRTLADPTRRAVFERVVGSDVTADAELVLAPVNFAEGR